MNDPLQNPHSDMVTESDEISLLDLLLVIVENLQLLVLGPLAVGLVALGISFVVIPTFTGTTVFLPPQQQQSSAAMLLQSLGSLGGLAGAATGLKNPNDQFVSFLQSDAVEDALVDRFELMKRYNVDFKMDARKALEDASKISSGKDGLIKVEFDDKDPVFAANLANAYVEELRKLLDRLALTEAQQRRTFFEKQLIEVKGKLEIAERALQATGVNGSAFKSSPEAAIGAVAQLQAQIAAKEIKLGSMRGYLNEGAPDFKQAQTELAALRAQYTKFENSGATATGGDSDYVARYRDFKYNETLFELFAKQFELAKVDEAREGAVIQVVDFAVPGERKSKPKRGFVAVLATLTSGFLLLLFVFIRHSLLQTGNDPQAAAKVSAIKVSFKKALNNRQT